MGHGSYNETRISRNYDRLVPSGLISVELAWYMADLVDWLTEQTEVMQNKIGSYRNNNVLKQFYRKTTWATRYADRTSIQIN